MWLPMNYECFEDGKKMVEPADACPYEMPHNFPQLFDELCNDCMVIKEASAWLCFCHCCASCEAPLHALVCLVPVQSYLVLQMSLSALVHLPWHLATCCAQFCSKVMALGSMLG